MDRLKSALLRLADQLDTTVDNLVFNFRKRHQLFHPVQIIPYRTYGTVNRLQVRGRVITDKGIEQADESHTILDNLLNMYKRLESDEIPGALLNLRFQDHDHPITTDQEGHFLLDFEPAEPLDFNTLYHQVTIELLDAPLRDVPAGLMAQADVLIPPPDAEFGVISDIDDTIVESSATNVLKMSRTALFTNARTRLPFAGTTAFYRALIMGRNGKRNNPFFYVSSSPWNLYDLITDYLDLQKLPKGPVLLRHLGLDADVFMGGNHQSHKMHQIDNLMLTYPKLKFVLIGDSGQQDPVIYREVVKKYPHRVLAIYIRDVEQPERAQVVIKIAEELQQGGEVEMVLVENSLKAAEHAARIGLIEAHRLDDVRADKKADESLPEDPEEAVAQQVEGKLQVPEKHA